MESLLCLQISEKNMEQIRGIIVEILRESGAKCGLLMDSAGNLLVRKGFTLIRQIDNLCALIAASRATTHAIAQILGQNEISVIFHQGVGDHLHNTDVGEKAILTLIFDDRADLTQIRRVVGERVVALARLIESVGEAASDLGPAIENLKDEADKKFDLLFRGVADPSEEKTPKGENA